MAKNLESSYISYNIYFCIRKIISANFLRITAKIAKKSRKKDRINKMVCLRKFLSISRILTFL